MAYTNEDQLIDRIKGNYADFRRSLRGVSRMKLFETAERIAAVKEAYRMLTEEYVWDEEGEVGFFLMFRDPLTIVADAWETRDYRQDFYDVMYDLSDDGGIISQYPLLEGSDRDIAYTTGKPCDGVSFYTEI